MPTVKKSTCERYDLRTGRPSEWAIILLAEAGGILSIQSDYGDWNHHWPHHGRPSFKHLLIELDNSRDYLIGKLGGHQTDFDFDESVKRLRRKIGELYKNKRRIHYRSRVEVFDLERAKDALAAVEDLDHTGSADDFARQVYDNSAIVGLETDEYCEIIVKRDSRSLLMFLERLWPLFVAELRREVATN